MPTPADELPDYHPLTVLRDWGGGAGFRLIDAQTGVICFGATGSGKTSGPAKHLAVSYLAADFGGVVLCAKKEERAQWEAWAESVGRWNRATQQGDLIIFDKAGKWRFNFLDWEASRLGEGGGLTINIVALLDEIAGSLAGGAGKGEGGGDNKFFEDALHHMNTNLVDLPLFAGIPVSLPQMRAVVNSAPLTPDEAASSKWLDGDGECATIIRAADAITREKGDPDTRADFEECRAYWLQEWPSLSEKTRSIIQLSFSMLVRPLLTRPLRRLFSSDTNVQPEDTFQGKIIIIDLPVQEFRLAGRVANLLWKYCTQIAILRRTQPTREGHYLRPVFLWADECQNFVSSFDTEYQAVARSAGGCTVYLTQTREALRRVLGNSDSTDALLANLQAKFFCQNTGDTNEWASKSVFGERWMKVDGSSIGMGALGGGPSVSTNFSYQLRRFVDPVLFSTLRRGGPKHEFLVDCVVYNGGALFRQDPKNPDEYPFKLLTFNQK